MESNSNRQLYQNIGNGYSSTRRPDPRIKRLIITALGDAQSVVNVGAGTGNYEPADRRLVAVEPSLAMISQRRPGAAPAVRAVAEALPFGDQTFEASLAILTLHHWADVAGGLLELRRVASRQVVLLFEPWVSWQFWLVEYFPECLLLPSEIRAPTSRPCGCTLTFNPSFPCPCQLTASMDSPGHIGAGRSLTWTLRYGLGFRAWDNCHTKWLNGGPKVAPRPGSGVWDTLFGHPRELSRNSTLGIGL